MGGDRGAEKFAITPAPGNLSSQNCPGRQASRRPIGELGPSFYTKTAKVAKGVRPESAGVFVAFATFG
ncbi:MAG: hypothetical protein DUW69_000019 [Verrucomicrobia bacterium]|jgi:hypothetical protein|nr:MAG: hypothetical protein DUW69_000019 [Verrucomicrobiota bacterium]